MPIGNTAGGPSLLPYLNKGSAGMALDLDHTPVQPSSSLPVAESCGPFAVMRRGRIVVDEKCSIAAVMVLSQSDAYSFVPSELAPMTNLDIERQWRQAWKKIQSVPESVRSEGDPVALPIQLDDQGGLIPLRPLFYCRHMNQYGHPLCPFCGDDLVLCRDDQVLQKAGLPAYSGSLTRYLYCRACHGGDSRASAPFYQNVLPPDPPDRVQGGSQLIEGFSRLLAKADLAGDLPCIGCSEAANCYGNETLALQRMTSVQFYPFYMLLQRAPDLDALDFIALISGAGGEEIEKAWARSQKTCGSQLVKKSGAGFLFADDERFFLEVLYLKLSFLHELWALAINGVWGAAGRMTLAGVGVNLPDHGPRLPYLWNFSLKLIDPVGQPASPAMGSATSQTLTLEFFARAWFYVLLVNKRQSMEEILTVVAGLQPLDDGMGDGPSPWMNDPVFASGNIFWQAPSIDPEPPWKALWKEVLGLGAQLLQAQAGRHVPETFEQHLMDLKARVRQILFQARDVCGPDEKAAAGESADDRIADILESLLEKWVSAQPRSTQAPQTGKSVSAAAMPDPQPNEDGDYEETIILSTQAGVDRGRLEAPEEKTSEKTVVLTPAVPEQSDADPEKTVVIAAQGPPPVEDDLEKTVAIKPHAPPAPPEDSEKTVVISAPPPLIPNDDLEKTVVIGAPPAPAADDDLDQTVVQSPAGARRSRSTRPQPMESYHMPAPKPSAEDDLEATVVIQPKSGKDGRSKP